MAENQPPLDMEWNAAGIARAGADLAAAAAQAVSFGQLPPGKQGEASRNLDLLLDINIPISVEVGRAQMTLDEVLRLVPGSVIALDKKAEEPVDLRVNGKLVARGEIVMVDDVYGLRITQIVDKAGRIESLR
ncbi:MAG TPA: flagellar motor switch protein FliN [Planctomycetota bacterium]